MVPESGLDMPACPATTFPPWGSANMYAGNVMENTMKIRKYLHTLFLSIVLSIAIPPYVTVHGSQFNISRKGAKALSKNIISFLLKKQKKNDLHRFAIIIYKFSVQCSMFKGSMSHARPPRKRSVAGRQRRKGAKRKYYFFSAEKAEKK